MPDAALALARAGDEVAFRELIDPYHSELRLHCYRMLGSLTDAEDLLQEILLAAWLGLSTFEGRSSVRTWLYRIATNRCINARRDRDRRRPSEPVPPFEPPEPTDRDDLPWLQPYPDTLLDATVTAAAGPESRYDLEEAVELAFIVGLQHLAPRQAAVLVLRDVLGFSVAEVAATLAVTETVVKGALQRARRTIDRRRTAANTASHGASGVETEVARRFAQSLVAGDIDAVVSLLTSDARMTMPPASHGYRGPRAVGQFLRTSTAWRADRPLLLLPTGANGQPAFGCYIGSPPPAPAAEPAGLLVLTMAGGRISAITRFLDETVLPRFFDFGSAPVSRRGDQGAPH